MTGGMIYTRTFLAPGGKKMSDFSARLGVALCACLCCGAHAHMTVRTLHTRADAGPAKSSGSPSPSSRLSAERRTAALSINPAEAGIVLDRLEKEVVRLLEAGACIACTVSSTRIVID